MDPVRIPVFQGVFNDDWGDWSSKIWIESVLCLGICNSKTQWRPQIDWWFCRISVFSSITWYILGGTEAPLMINGHLFSWVGRTVLFPYNKDQCMAEIIEYQPSILPLYPFGFLWIVSWKLHSTHWLIMMTCFFKSPSSGTPTLVH